MGGNQMKKLGITVLALTLAVLLAAPAMAASITPYASMRLGTYWVDHDFNDYNPSWTDDSDDASFMIDIADISRFGAKGQVGDIFGVVELGLTGQENDNEYTWAAYGGDNNTVYTRLIYGKWDFGSGTLLVGQDYSPVTYTSSQQGPGIFDDERNQSYDLQNAFIGVGTLWDSRIPQIKINLDNGFYFMVAQVDDNTPQNAGGGDVDLTIPKTVIGFNYKTEGLYLGPGFTYQSYNYEEGSFDDDIESWILYLHGKVNFGAVDIKFTGHYGENLGDYAITGRANRYSGFNASRAYVDVANDDIDDAECFGGWIQASFPVDPCTVSLGWGYASQENDDADPMYDQEDELMGWFINCKIPIADNFSATPEFDYWDGMENAAGQDDPDHWALGITWQMDF
jgi:hypothetical protein